VFSTQTFNLLKFLKVVKQVRTLKSSYFFVNRNFKYNHRPSSTSVTQPSTVTHPTMGSLLSISSIDTVCHAVPFQTIRTIHECAVCYDKQLKVALEPCGHLLCERCSSILDECPYCRKKISNKLQIHLK
jgi:Zinc finger, C3HC4 type (RING finger)